jgi:hypothetical protein
MKKSWFVIAAAIGLVVIASVAVLRTSGEDSRRQGALGTDEPVTLEWHGDWNAEAQYTAGSVVIHEGASYVAEGEGEKLSTPEPECTDCGWTVMALEGAGAETTKEEPTVPPLRGYETVSRDMDIGANATGVGHTVDCPAGKMPLGGGGRAVPPARMTGMSPGPVKQDASGMQTGSWTVWFENPAADLRAATIYAACANAS